VRIPASDHFFMLHRDRAAPFAHGKEVSVIVARRIRASKLFGRHRNPNIRPGMQRRSMLRPFARDASSSFQNLASSSRELASRSPETKSPQHRSESCSLGIPTNNKLQSTNSNSEQPSRDLERGSRDARTASSPATSSKRVELGQKAKSREAKLVSSLM